MTEDETGEVELNTKHESQQDIKIKQEITNAETKTQRYEVDRDRRQTWDWRTEWSTRGDQQT